MSLIPTISNQSCQGILRCAAALEVESEALCRAAGVGVGQFSDPEGRVGLPTYYDLLEHLAEASGDPHVGLRLPALGGAEDYGLLSFLFLSSATVGQAYERIIRYQRLLISDLQLTMEVDAKRVAFTYTLWGPARPAHAVVGDAFVAESLMGVGMLCGAEVELNAEALLTRPPVDPAPYLGAVGVRPAFSAPHLQVSFDAAVLDLPVVGANPALAEVLERQAKIMMRLLPESSAQDSAHAPRVRKLLVELLPDGAPKIERVAKRMGQSPRSLQRHLREEGHTLSGLLDEVRASISRAQLRQGASTTEVALLLGYSELSAFHRAFKRWTGVTPGNWR